MSLRRHAALPAAVGAVIGLASAGYQRLRALSAVRVRPELDDVGFVDAALTEHGADWLFYHYPVAATVATVVLGAALGAVIGLVLVTRHP